MLILLFIVFINGFLGLLIFLRNTRSVVNRLFLLLTAGTYTWAICSYLTDNAAVSQRLWWGRLAFFFPVVVTLSIALLSRYFPLKLKTSQKELVSVVGISLIGMAITLTPLVAKSAHPRGTVTDLEPGSMYFGFIAIELFLFGYSVRNYVVSQRYSNAVQKLQARLVAFGFMVSFLWALLFNVLLPIVVTSWEPTKLGPLGTVIFVSFTAYSIVKHKLFDIRLIVARSLAYLLSLLSLGGIFILVAFSVSNVFFGGNHLSVDTLRWLYAIIAVVLAALFPTLKQFFDKTTNRLFYRDAYDVQDFLNQLNKILVTTYKLNPLLSKSAKVVGDNIKPTFCAFCIQEPEKDRKKILCDKENSHLDEKEVLKVIKEIEPRFKDVVMVSDNLNEDSKLHETLRSQGISAIAQLNPSSSNRGTGVGYLVLGAKKSGNLYSSQDVKVIEIIANELAIAIQNALRFEEIERFNLTLQGKVQEATAKLRRTNEKLKTLDETKDDFISMASHQLRTPLTSVKGYLSMVVEGDVGKLNANQMKMLSQAYASSQRMVYLIADLLNVSRLKTGKFIIEPTPTDLSQVIEEEIAQLAEEAKNRNLTLIFEKPKAFPQLMLDETKTRQVIMNFIDNALYYTPSGGQIHVKLLDKPGSVELRVEDNGIGVPKSEQHHLFTKFYRAGNARKARPDGTGLGLFMAKKVVVAQGGAIIFETQEGKGSTFGFTFSKAKLALPEEKAATST